VADTSICIEDSSSEEEEEETDSAASIPPTYARRSLVAAIRTMTRDDRGDLLDDIALESDQDF